MNDLVIIKNEQVVVSSRSVAENFIKEHKNVLASIKDILTTENSAATFFMQNTYIHQQNGQQYPEYLMNRDGFSLLVMGFTGKEALQWKLKYIQAFNKMEKQLLKETPAQLMARALIVANQTIEKCKAENIVLKKKETAYTALLDYSKHYSVGNVAKFFSIGRNTLFKILRSINAVNIDNTPSAYCINQDYMSLKNVFVAAINSYKQQTFITNRGLDYIARQLFKHKYISALPTPENLETFKNEHVEYLQ